MAHWTPRGGCVIDVLYEKHTRRRGDPDGADTHKTRTGEASGS